jgi:bifunctional NMN adenylyltransferase/nudix hydrolase
MKYIPDVPLESYDVAVVIGRWQIVHKGHITLFTKALALAPTVIIAIGSAFKARDTRNPFNVEERKEQILRCVPAQDRERIKFVMVRDYYKNERWAKSVQRQVAELTQHGQKIALVGFKKDHTSVYLQEFPQWRYEGVVPEHQIDATPLRNIFFGTSDSDTARVLMAPYVTDEVLNYLMGWRELPAYASVATEHAEVLAYRKKWNAPVYLTADAVVQVSDHVLLIQRGGAIGRGLWALPGGFLNQNEEFLPGAIRELNEETKLGFLDSTMYQSVKSSAVFCHALRSPRGRLVTEAFYFCLGDMKRLPEVHASDDAMDVRWVHISDLPAYVDKLFEDHACILDHFVGIPGF